MNSAICLLAVLCCTTIVLGSWDTVRPYQIYGDMNLWLAANNAHGGAWADAEHPVEIPIPEGAVQVLFATNSSYVVNFGFAQVIPVTGMKTGSQGFSATIPPHNGFSGYTGPWDTLVGVFTASATTPNAGAVPPTLDFSINGIYTNKSQVTAQLYQVFYVGAGVPVVFNTTNNGPTVLSDTRIVYNIPAGAQFLYLGVREDYGGDLCCYYDNTGFYLTGVQFLPSCATCGNGIVEYPEKCDDSSVCCQNCTFAANTTVCRASVGSCDVPEYCNGVNDSCAADVFVSNKTVCRNSTGVCDVAETCTGKSGICPAQLFVNSTVVCRPSADVCDTPENCTGSDAACPNDGFLNNQTICRPLSVICDTNQLCTGNYACCPMSPADLEAQNYVVFGYQSIFHAGEEGDYTEDSGDSPIQSPVPDCSNYIEFNATGIITDTVRSYVFGPQGNNITGETQEPLSVANPKANGISGYNGPRVALVGVFLAVDVHYVAVQPATAPPTIAWLSNLATNNATQSPPLGQVFYIGNGFPAIFNATGYPIQTSFTQTKYFIPANAGVLYLGFAAAPNYWSNFAGSYATTVQYFGF